MIGGPFLYSHVGYEDVGCFLDNASLLLGRVLTTAKYRKTREVAEGRNGPAWYWLRIVQATQRLVSDRYCEGCYLGEGVAAGPMMIESIEKDASNRHARRRASDQGSIRLNCVRRSLHLHLASSFVLD